MDDTRRRFDAEVLPHLDAAYRFARWLSSSRGDAEDIVQEALLRAFRGIDGLRTGDAKAWLFAIVRNCHSTAVRRERRRPVVPLPEEHDREDGHSMIAATPDPESDTIRADERRALARLLANLPEEQREVLVLREIEDMGYREIAAVIGIPIGTVMSRLSRARAALKELWRPQMEGDIRAMP
jgi:RNA polymerase sigma-70 factor (ECF subfamily)